MKSISTKLFLALLSLTAVILFATLLLARWSFDYGFLDYLNAQQQQRLNNMANDLSAHYQNNGGAWSESVSREYRDIYKKWFPGPASRPPHGRPPHDNKSSKDRGHLAHERAKADQKKHNSKFSKRFHEPIVVLDSEGNYIAGHTGSFDGKELLSASITYQQQIVGSIEAIKQIKVSSGVESAFSKQQTKASLIIAIICLAIAGIASWCLSKMLLAPTYKMKNAIGDLVKGDFSNRLDVNRDDELGRLMLDINKLSESLHQNRLSRRRWIADISHELRTPVAILSGELEAVIDGIRPLNKNTIESLDHEVNRLKHLIDDLYQLSLSDIGGLRYEFEPLDLAQLLETIIGQHASRISNAELSLNVDLTSSLIIDADSARLEQLFTNLINNSIAYTDAPGILDIKLSLDKQYAVLYFNDSSPSVAPDQLDEIFEPLFRQDSSRNRSKAGAGLGLTISKNIVKAHGGDINVRASKLGGLEFIVTLPMKRK